MSPAPLLCFWLFYVFGNHSIRTSQATAEPQIKLSPDCFYLVCRGTKQKAGIVAGSFNYSDPNITHIGIGIVENNSLKIFHVDNKPENSSAFVVEDFKDFTTVSGLRYAGIWQYRSNARSLQHLKNILTGFAGRPIQFDMDFTSDVPNKLYCSEFCVEVLQQLNPKDFRFKCCRKKLDAFSAVLLQREFLKYYPVDFFKVNHGFKKIYEKFYAQP